MMIDIPDDKLVAGVDEVGRGPLVGDVVTAAVILDPANPIEGLADSKKLSEKKRLALYGEAGKSVPVGGPLVAFDVEGRGNVSTPVAAPKPRV